jgi:hypothetical protein
MSPGRRLRAVGYWFDDAAPNRYPRAQALVGRWDPTRRRAVVAYLRRGALYEAYGACASCRFDCGAPARVLGHRDLFDGVYVWPEGLAHTVEAHAVRLPEGFIRRALTGPDPARLRRPHQRDGTVDDAWWLAWAARRGALVDLRGWARPGPRDRARLPPVVADADLLALGRGGRRGLVRWADGRLGVVDLGLGRIVRVLPGWAAWPAGAE